MTVVLAAAIVIGSLGWFYPSHCSPPEDTSVAGMIAWERATDTLGTTAKGEYLPIWVDRMPDAEGPALDAAYAAFEQDAKGSLQPGKLADFIVILHLAFVVFAVGGALLVVRWPRLAWVHVPAAIWAALIEFAGWICPLTPLEKWLRVQGGGDGYDGGFVDHYILPILYPRELTREVQIALGILVLVINVGIYAWVIRRRARDASRGVDRA